MEGEHQLVDVSTDIAAGNGLLDRRWLLKKMLGGAGGLTLAAIPVASAFERVSADMAVPTNQSLANPPWRRQPGEPFSNYGQPSAHENGIIRWVSANADVPGNGVSWCPLHELEGTITPNGLHFERHHNGVPRIDPDQHRLVIHGLVKRALIFDMEKLLRYPLVSHIGFIECGGNSNAGWHTKPVQTAAGYFNGLVSCSEWIGVPLSVLLTEAGVDKRANWLIAEGADAISMNMSLPLEKAMDDAILALYQNGERIRPENGYPLRLIVPGWEGVLNVKWLTRLEVAQRPAMTRNETARYTELLPSGKARMFTFGMQVKSLITNPSAGMRLPAHGLFEVKGLAWSGYGKIKRVEVSADGGQTWADAALDDPVLPKCFTRFRIPWHWQGPSAILKSRATDERGDVQPERDVLLAERGRHGYYHYNAIVSWHADEQGNLTHVYA